MSRSNKSSDSNQARISKGLAGSSPPPIMVMDPEGDLILVVPSDAGTARFQIDSHIVCVASPVFRAMLGKNSRFKEASALASARSRSDSNTTSSRPTPCEITLYGDNAKALAVILRILHTKTTLVPKNLTKAQLFMVAVICDKYDMAQAVMLWVDVCWIPQHVPNNVKRPSEVTGFSWLFIAYVFGRRRLFRSLTKDIILNSTLDKSGALINAKTGTCPNKHIPDRIISELMSCRQHYIESMMHCTYQVMEKYNRVDVKELQCKNTSKQEACDSLVAGFLRRAFRRKKVYPVASTEVTHKSLRQIKDFLGDITFPGQVYCTNTAAPKTRNCKHCPARGHGTRKVASNGLCSRCGLYTHGALPGSNHSDTCSPVPRLKTDLEAICSKVVGLELSCFVHANNEGGKDDSIPGSGHDSLWDSITYE